jgi:hypothetical protein
LKENKKPATKGGPCAGGWQIEPAPRCQPYRSSGALALLTNRPEQPLGLPYRICRTKRARQ